MRGIYSWTALPLSMTMYSVGDINPRSGGGMTCQAAENPWQAGACHSWYEDCFCCVVSVVLSARSAWTPSAPG
ncbi:hypothetical protein CLB51_24150 [Salmonella enterica]|nr:hypothetical protein [Salmonella enterica]ECD3237412.1 hypothetical protein [Salmonella enterica subsp. enterica serovar Bredeney]EDR9399206.1 hypothetical protein [Salmonella enterica subsp. enterica]EDT6893189.1 hypothetical protein [Salmonella enterica subsp. enterica serovar Javiana]EDX5193544.1 hypothetical protein [Salmonella enterica subsp. enterica serovar Glostrup]